VLILGNTFRPNVTIADPETPGLTWVGSGLTRKHYTKLERLAKDKHSL